MQRQLLRLVLGVVSRPKLTLALCAIVLIVAAGFATARLRISADQNKLFDPSVAFFQDYLNFIHAFPENEAVYVVVRAAKPATPPPVARWTAVADAIADRLSQLPDVVKAVDARIPTARLGAQGLLFDTPTRVRQSVQDIRQFIPLIKIFAEKGGLTALILGGTPLERLLSSLQRAPVDKDSAALTKLLADSLVYAIEHDQAPRVGAGLPDLASLDATDPSRLGYYYLPDQLDPSQHLLLVRVYPKSNFDSLTAISKTIEAIDAGVRDVARPFTEFTVGLTGRPALDAAEMRSTDQDTRRAEILALAAVFIGLTIALRSLWLALAGELALGVGIGWTFGWATLSVGELNLLSIVFLLALIGIGMDYLVQILMRYRLEAARHSDPRRIWVSVFRHVSAPINTACLGAAGAFLVSVLTKFKGAADLGIIASGGLVLCLIAGYLVLPSLLVLLPLRKSARLFQAASSSSETRTSSWRYALLPIVWIGLLAAGSRYALRTHFNPELLNLQAPGHESVELVRHLQTWSAVVLSKDLDTLRKVRAAVSASPLVQSTDSILAAYDNLAYLQAREAQLPAIAWSDPPPIAASDLRSIVGKSADLAKKFKADAPCAATLTEFAHKLSDAPGAGRQDVAARLSAWQRGFFNQLRESVLPFSVRRLDVSALPTELRSHFVSDDGNFALYILPKADLWTQANLAEFVRDVEARIQTVPNAPAATGIAVEIYHSTDSIEHSFYHAAISALALIVVLVLIDLRRIGMTLLAISVLAFGLPMLVIAMGFFGIQWNFANFFALPILIGAGHEYGVFLVHRYIEARDFSSRRWRCWDVSDRALLLCAYVTCASFGFFAAIASHRGLRSLGLVMAIGTVCIYLASLLVLRPILKWRLAGKTHQRGAATESSSPSSRAGH